ncbi:MAG TPA: YkgJ family cysteine cluster protein [Solibacterales bacterium]|nr:YkgJ family cysteine cluster protein [Bryobacterales bacterium]
MKRSLYFVGRPSPAYTQGVIHDLVQIRRLGEKKRGENQQFRRWLKSHTFVERRFRKLAQEIEEQTDCTVCANCCRVATVRLKERDVEKLAKYFRISVDRFLNDYTQPSDEEGRILNRTAEGCVFLEGTACTVYDVRPNTCEDFPHLVRGAGSLLSRMWEMPDRATYCPIVYNTLESWKVESGFARKSE